MQTVNGGSGEESDNSDDTGVWDDELLIKAYDESVRLAKEDVARKVASATNTTSPKVDDSAGKRSLQWQPIKYKVGDFVRAIYRDDGIEYEAVVVSTSGGPGKYLVKFVGYENEQYVSTSELKDSLGGEARMEQIEASLASPTANDDESVASETPEAHSSTSTKKSEPPEPIPGPLYSLLNAGFMPPMSFQPPPLPPFANDNSEEGKHLAAMLMAWYTSGYYTGLYDAHRNSQKRKDEVKPSKSS